MSLISVGQAVQLLRANEVVAVPTETVYGLAARISSPQALEKIFTTKERPLFDPLIVHVRDITQARKLVTEWPAVLDYLAQTFWPGPLTLVVAKNSSVNPLITAGLDTVGLRAPAHPIAQQILADLNEPFAAPSANRFGRTSPTRAEHVEKEFSGQVAVVDGGPCQVGVESTVVRLQAGKQMKLEILRPGQISTEQIRSALKDHFPEVVVTRVVSNASPGHLEQHYQPRLPLIVSHQSLSPKQLRDLAEKYKTSENKIYRLSLNQNPSLAARELYHQLHNLSQNEEGLILYHAGSEWTDTRWEALVDRLTRAANFIII